MSTPSVTSSRTARAVAVGGAVAAALVTVVAGALAAPPSNDTQPGAIVLTLAQAAAVDTAEATGTGSEEVPGCLQPAVQGSTRGVWFRFTTPGSGIYTFSAAASDYATVISLVQPDGSFGGCAAGSTFAGSMPAGTTRDIYVGRSPTATGTGTIARITVNGPAGSTTPTTPTTPRVPGDPEEETPDEGGEGEAPDGEGGGGTRPTRPTGPAAPEATLQPGLRLEIAHVGQTLAVQTGRWSTRVTTKVAWLRAGKAIRGATRLRYRLTRADVGKRVSARVTATAASGGASTVVVTPGVMVRR